MGGRGRGGGSCAVLCCAVLCCAYGYGYGYIYAGHKE